MKIGAAALAVAASAALSVGAADRATAQRTRLACTDELRALKTLSDPQRQLVHLRPTETNIAAINRIRMPRPTPATRKTGFQRRAWRVRAQIVEYRLAEDGDVRLVLYDGKKSYMTAAMPSPACLSRRTRARGSIAGARAFFEGLCGPARSSWQDLGAVVYIDGVGFWQVPHGQYEHALNYAELHPVTRVQLIDGCA